MGLYLHPSRILRITFWWLGEVTKQAHRKQRTHPLKMVLTDLLMTGEGTPSKVRLPKGIKLGPSKGIKGVTKATQVNIEGVGKDLAMVALADMALPLNWVTRGYDPSLRVNTLPLSFHS